MAFVLLHLLFLLLLLLPFSVIAQTNGSIISLGSTLTAGEQSAWWLSPSSDFALGFHQLDNDHFLLAIWFHKIPQKTVVWYANEGNPAPRQSRVELTDQGLVLRTPQGDQQLWRTEFPTAAVAHGVMNDTGNFMIVGTSSSIVWQTFENPTDTLLPTQIMEIGGKLSSTQTETNFSRGKYQFRLVDDGNALLNPINFPTNFAYNAYYLSGTRDESNDTNSGYQVIFDQLGYLYVLRRGGERSYIIAPEQALSPTRYYLKATLHFDGVFIISYQEKDSTPNQSWSVLKTVPHNICVAIPLDLGTAPCGYNSICTLKADQRPTCRCPLGYSLLDPTDEYSNCMPDFLQQRCEEGGQSSHGESYYLYELPNTNFPTSDYALFKPYNVEACKTSCLEDFLCAAAVFRVRDNGCFLKKLPLSNGREDSGVSSRTFLKLTSRSSTPQSPIPQLAPKAEKQNTLIIVLSVLLGSSVILVGGICLGFFLHYEKKLSGIHQEKTCVESNLRYFTYKELIEATQGLKEELGRGSCGIVYKGKTDHAGAGGSVLAVKVLDRVFKDKEKEFKAEVKVIGQTHHKNLVRLIGYCDEGEHRLLVYEYLSNGTLASFLFGNFKPSWTQRSHIALGIARGLFYLHEECSTQIIHCDIKPQNILLDEYYNARISDFGLAKLLSQTQASKTAIRGTKGYVAPDWFRSAPVSVKVDVYSFGVLLLEIVCCRRNVDVEAGDGEMGVLTDWANNCYMEHRLDALIENDTEAMNDMSKVERFVMVAIWCLQEDPTVRPTMKKVMLMLEGIVQVSVPPSLCPSSSIS